MGPSKRALQVIRDNLEEIIHYPDPDCLNLRQVISEERDIPVDNIIIGNGAVELIFLLAGLIKPAEVLIPAPTFGEYEIAARSAGANVKYFDLKRDNNFKIDSKTLGESLPGVDLLFLCNPNNPTGQLMTRQEVLAVLDEARKTSTMVVVDEAFLDFLPERDKYSVAGFIREYENLFVLYSLTKFFAIPGLRLGAAFGRKQLITRLNQGKDPWNVNTLAQFAGVASFQDREYMKNTIEFVHREKDYLYHELKKIKGLIPYQPAANYIFIDISPTGLDSTTLVDKLGSKGILVRDCSSYRNLKGDFIRVAVKDRKDNLKLIEALRNLKG